MASYTEISTVPMHWGSTIPTVILRVPDAPMRVPSSSRRILLTVWSAETKCWTRRTLQVIRRASGIRNPVRLGTAIGFRLMM